MYLMNLLSRNICRVVQLSDMQATPLWFKKYHVIFLQFSKCWNGYLVECKYL